MPEPLKPVAPSVGKRTVRGVFRIAKLVTISVGLTLFIIWFIVSRPAISLPQGPVIAYILDPHHHFSFDENRPHLGRWYKLEERTLSPDEASRVRALINGHLAYGLLETLCFIPRIGFRFGEGKNAVDVPVCVECEQIQFRAGEKVVEKSLSMFTTWRFQSLSDDLFPNAKNELREADERFEAEMRIPVTQPTTAP